MVKKLLFCVGLLLYLNSYPQDLTFTYDAAGNQTFRGPGQTNTSLQNFATTSNDTIQNLENTSIKNELIVINAAPNPTSGHIRVEWQNTSQVYFKEMTLLTYTNQALSRYQFNKDTNSYAIDLSRYPQGVYIAIFTTNRGTTQPYRIIKK